MTIEESIKDIKENIQSSVCGKSLEMAIAALENQIPKAEFQGEHRICICGSLKLENIVLSVGRKLTGRRWENVN